ncbi:MAG: YihY/virulence factor BrkB family protein [Gemmatimonadetes bacterium]|nr:YihY/virulence factor BrkB family protein [Gemmatimonadota bacterium]
MPAHPTHDPRSEIVRHPGKFALRVLKGFRANQGLLLAGAVAYYALLSLVPLLILILFALSHLIDRAQLLSTVDTYLQFVVAGESGTVVNDLSAFLDHEHAIGGVLLATMVLSSALAFTVLENAMSVIFAHRVLIHRRRFLVSALLPYFFIMLLGLGLVVVTAVSGGLSLLTAKHFVLFGLPGLMGDLTGLALYAMGVAGEVMMLTAVYLVMPVGVPSWRHALIGGATATLLWEITRHVLVWYLASVSHIQAVYGSLTTAIAALLTVEAAAVILLLGAQVIAEYERVLIAPADAKSASMRV